MKIVSFDDSGELIGAVIGDMVLDVKAARPFLPSRLSEIFRSGLLPEVQNLVDNASEIDRAVLRPLKDLKLLPPIVDPSKIICLGLNYRSHASEQGKEAPDHPILFAKAPSALAGPFDDIVVRPGVEDVDAEAELAVVIGREGTMINKEAAMDYVAGYMIMNDVSARRVQRSDKQWFRGKSFDTFAPCGPWLVTADETGDPRGFIIRQLLNDTVMQEGSTSEMIFRVPEIIAFISAAMTLLKTSAD